jgi:hypothetical protein
MTGSQIAPQQYHNVTERSQPATQTKGTTPVTTNNAMPQNHKTFNRNPTRTTLWKAPPEQPEPYRYAMHGIVPPLYVVVEVAAPAFQRRTRQPAAVSSGNVIDVTRTP